MRFWEIRQEKSENNFERAVSTLNAKVCSISGIDRNVGHYRQTNCDPSRRQNAGKPKRLEFAARGTCCWAARRKAGSPRSKIKF